MQTLICVRDLQYALHFKLSKEKKKGLKRKQHAAAKVKTMYSFERLRFISLLSKRKQVKN